MNRNYLPILLVTFLVNACAEEDSGDMRLDETQLEQVNTEVDNGQLGLVPKQVADDVPRVFMGVSASSSHVAGLMRRAISGLGMNDAWKPNKNDLFFIGKHYLVWIDQTGFVGKMNGLWQLNGLSGTRLDFVFLDGERPVNVFIPGEFGDGKWREGYAGSEHYELPNVYKSDGSGELCGKNHFDGCSQYAHMEGQKLGPGKSNEGWKSCNDYRGFPDKQYTPTKTDLSNGVELLYADKLVRVADFEGPADGNDCNEDWIFSDGKKRPVYMQTGYKLYKDQPYFDRIYGIYNPKGNPEFTSEVYGVILGNIITRWPNPHPKKQIANFWKLDGPATGDTNVCWDGGECPGSPAHVEIGRNKFKAVGLGKRAGPDDVVLGWSGSGVTLSQYGESVGGYAFHHDVLGNQGHEDVGACLCAVHGGIEMGGGIFHGPKSNSKSPMFPIASGKTKKVERRFSMAPKGPPVLNAGQCEVNEAIRVLNGQRYTDLDEQRNFLISYVHSNQTGNTVREIQAESTEAVACLAKAIHSIVEETKWMEQGQAKRLNFEDHRNFMIAKINQYSQIPVGTLQAKTTRGLLPLFEEAFDSYIAIIIGAL